MSGAPFLTAEWRDLLIVNFEVAPERLLPFVPAHTALDLYHGTALASLVGFRFLRTRVLGIPIPGHVDFDEMNLRFYVTRTLPDGTLRRGVTFLGEIVPRRAIAWVARIGYGEPYRALPMAHDLPGEAGDGRVAYRCLVGETWHGFSAHPHGSAGPAPDDPLTAFITEHYWGYTRRSAMRTDEYQVRHPAWRARAVNDVHVDLDVATVYGSALADILPTIPHSAFLAEGSPVSVHRGTVL